VDVKSPGEERRLSWRAGAFDAIDAATGPEVPRESRAAKFFASMEPLEPLGSHSCVNGASSDVVPAAPSVRDDSFGAFYRSEYGRAVRLAWLLTGSRPGAEDVVQDAMAAVYRAFERIELPSAYLRRAVVNTARSWHRDERRQQERSTLLALEPHTVDARDAELLDAVARLPYRQRVVIVARYWGGWSEAEIAQSLSCRPGTVKSLASRALNRLRREVEQ
jgi:RNA polymerase sigma-70 factor (sigma-E family)